MVRPTGGSTTSSSRSSPGGEESARQLAVEGDRPDGLPHTARAIAATDDRRTSRQLRDRDITRELTGALQTFRRPRLSLREDSEWRDQAETDRQRASSRIGHRIAERSSASCDCREHTAAFEDTGDRRPQWCVRHDGPQMDRRVTDEPHRLGPFGDRDEIAVGSIRSGDRHERVNLDTESFAPDTRTVDQFGRTLKGVSRRDHRHPRAPSEQDLIQLIVRGEGASPEQCDRATENSAHNRRHYVADPTLPSRFTPTRHRLPIGN